MLLQHRRWRHIVINTHCTWLHGDPRGFRSRDHRIHSSGDYKNPPPKGEHAGLYPHRLTHSDDPTHLPPEACKLVGDAIAMNSMKQQFRLAAIAVNPTHTHVLVELPDNVARIKEIVGWFKWFATRSLRQAHRELGNIEIWADGETYKAVDDAAHFASTRQYILTKQGSDAWTFAPVDQPSFEVPL